MKRFLMSCLAALAAGVAQAEDPFAMFVKAEFAVNEAVSIAVPVESVSYPTVKVAGLPSGLNPELNSPGFRLGLRAREIHYKIIETTLLKCEMGF